MPPAGIYIYIYIYIPHMGNRPCRGVGARLHPHLWTPFWCPEVSVQPLIYYPIVVIICYTGLCVGVCECAHLRICLCRPFRNHLFLFYIIFYILFYLFIFVSTYVTSSSTYLFRYAGCLRSVPYLPWPTYGPQWWASVACCHMVIVLPTCALCDSEVGLCGVLLSMALWAC